jgi:hypothetical protein
MGGHDLPYGHRAQPGLQHRLLVFGAGRADQEPAEQDEPDPAVVAQGQDEIDADDGQDPAEYLAGPGGPYLGLQLVLGDGPQHRPQQPSPVQRCGRDHVEHRQQDVDPAEPGQRGHQHLRAAACSGRPGQQREQPAEQQAAERAGAGHAEFGPRIGELALEPGHSAQQPQRDVLDLDPVTPRHERMGQFVGEQGRHVDQRGQHGGHDVFRLRTMRDLGGELADREPVGQQGHDDQHAPVHADPDAGDPA